MADTPFIPDMSVMADKWAQQGPSRQLTAVAVEGELGASYTVYATNWKCGECKGDNYPSRNRCHRCRAPKSKAADQEAGSGLIINGRSNDWREVLDPASKQLYYVNTATRETSWERPQAMGPAPHATGWFGRGAAGSDAAAKLESANESYLARPARKQASAKMASTSVVEGGGEYNIWYNKFLGDYGDRGRDRAPAEARCIVASDAGFTKADKHANNSKFFCLFWARGNCAYGHTCQYHHRIPVRADVTRMLNDELRDMFGRHRHKDHREDMDGVGSVLKPCRTLFVGGLANRKYSDPKALEVALWTAFGEFGEVENINVIVRLSIAFVRYRHRCHAEIGKEAMGQQALDHEEVLSVRWAFDDPNPVALEAAKRADADAVVNMMQMRGVALLPPPPIGAGSDPAAAAAASGVGANGCIGVGINAGVDAAPGGAGGGGGGGDDDVEALALAGAFGEAAQQAAQDATSRHAAPAPATVNVSALTPDDYAMPAPKRVRVHEAGAGGGGEGGEGAAAGAAAAGATDNDTITAGEAAHLDRQYAKAGIVWYPDTDSQFNATAAAATANAGTGSVPQPVATSAGSGGGSDSQNGGDDDDVAAFWKPAQDPASRSTYFYNERTQETAWSLAPEAIQASAHRAAREAASRAASTAAAAAAATAAAAAAGAP